MRLDPRLLGLPASLILLITSRPSAATGNEQSPAQCLNERSQDESLLQEIDRRDSGLGIQKPLQRKPVGVRKMSNNPGEKFFPEYWAFEEDMAQSIIPEALPSSLLRTRHEAEESRLSLNGSAEISFRSPFALHSDRESTYQDLKARRSFSGREADALAALLIRDFNCPTGTSSCSAIGYPNACCATGEQCFNTTDTGLGSVGCCPDGVTCAGTISSCEANYTPCVKGGGDYSYGGCCLPNYVCAGVGCVINPTLIVTVVVTQTFTGFFSHSTIQTSTIISTSIPSTSTSSATTSTATNIQSQTTPNSVSSTGLAPIVRPTDSSTINPTSNDTGFCPTGFYACSAYYRGGCCRTDRDCNTYSCPPTSSTTIVSGSETIVVPAGAAATVTTPTGPCAGGWSTCPASVGGNCCLSGWECGTASCTSISASQTAVVQKGSPQKSGAQKVDVKSGIWTLAGLLIVISVLIRCCSLDD